jgi:hypothetical protein
MRTFTGRRFMLGERVFVCDLAIMDGQLITTVELKKSGGRYWADFWTSSRLSTIDLTFVARAQSALGRHHSEDAAAKEAVELYEKFVKPLAVRSIESKGFPEPQNAPVSAFREAQAWIHLVLHAEAGHLPPPGAPVAVRTALQYKLIKSMGFSAATPMIAEFEGVTPTAVDRRLFMAREANHLAKMSDAVGKKEADERRSNKCHDKLTVFPE